MGLLLLVLGGLALGAWALASGDETMGAREIWLQPGRRYAVTWAESGNLDTASAQSMWASMGFCDFSELTLLGQQNTVSAVAFEANWCGAPTLWQVPENVSIQTV